MAGGSYRNNRFGASLAWSQLEDGGPGHMGTLLSSLRVDNGPAKVNRYAGWYLNLQRADVSGFLGVRNGTGLRWGLSYIHPIHRKFWWAVFVGANGPSAVAPAGSAAGAIDPLRAQVVVRQCFQALRPGRRTVSGGLDASSVTMVASAADGPQFASPARPGARRP